MFSCPDKRWSQSASEPLATKVDLAKILQPEPGHRQKKPQAQVTASSIQDLQQQRLMNAVKVTLLFNWHGTPEVEPKKK